MANGLRLLPSNRFSLIALADHLMLDDVLSANEHPNFTTFQQPQVGHLTLAAPISASFTLEAPTLEAPAPEAHNYLVQQLLSRVRSIFEQHNQLQPYFEAFQQQILDE